MPFLVRSVLKLAPRVVVSCGITWPRLVPFLPQEKTPYLLLWCNGPVEGGTLCLRVDDGTSGRNVDNNALSFEWPVDAALLVGWYSSRSVVTRGWNRCCLRVKLLTYRACLQIIRRSRLIEIERTDERLQYIRLWIEILAPLSKVNLTHLFGISMTNN